MLHGEHFSRPRIARLDFIGNQYNAVFVTNLPHGAHEFGRRNVEAAFALHGFQNDGGHIFGRDFGFQDAADGFHGIVRADVLRGGREIGMVNAGGHGAEIGLVRQHFAGQRQRHQRTPVKCAAKGNHAVPFGVCAGNFHRVFHRFRACREKLDFAFARNRQQPDNPFGQCDIAFIRGELECGVGEFVQLRFHGSHDFRVAVPCVHHADAAGKIDKFAPVGGFERGVLCAFHKPVAADGSAFGQNVMQTCF